MFLFLKLQNITIYNIENIKIANLIDLEYFTAAKHNANYRIAFITWFLYPCAESMNLSVCEIGERDLRRETIACAPRANITYY